MALASFLGSPEMFFATRLDFRICLMFKEYDGRKECSPPTSTQTSAEPQARTASKQAIA